MATRQSGPAGFWRSYGLTALLLGLFLVAIAGQALSGWGVYNAEKRDHHESPVGFVRYLTSSQFWETTSENWESEFLQMSTLVILTVFLRQRGSPESQTPGLPPAREKQPGNVVPFRPRWRRAGLGRVLYEHSLSIVLVSLFLMTFSLHVVSGAAKYNAEQRQHGGESVSVAGFLGTPQVWFESTQNWQSEFLSSGLLVILTVFLREKGSSESKAVDAPNESNHA